MISLSMSWIYPQSHYFINLNCKFES